ncbi:MAG: glycosyltransferase family 39 protein [Actinomycetota bacterium]|nr:glycosyltransferase family 39 protein [Actinomycetota bacterium]
MIDTSPDSTATGVRQAKWLSVSFALICFVVGIVGRIYLASHSTINSDEAVVGLMAVHIRHLDTPALFWGQGYGGVEPYVVAAFGTVFGFGTFVITFTPIFLAALATFVLFLILKAKLSTYSALVASAIVWIWPAPAAWNSVKEYGFRGAELVLGLLVVYILTLIRRDPAPLYRWVALGLMAGLAIWATPESVYFLFPCAIYALASLFKLPWSRSLVASMVALVGVMVGALPWIYVTVHSHFLTLKNQTVVSASENYLFRLGVFFHHTLPIALGVQVPLTGAWILGGAEGKYIYLIILLVLVAGSIFAIIRNSILAPVSLSVLIYPFIYAIFPASFYWFDARYVAYLPFLCIVAIVEFLLAIKSLRIFGSTRFFSLPTKVGAIAIAVLLIVSGNYSMWQVGSSGLVEHGRTYNIPMGLIDSLKVRGVRYVYAGYWVAYDLMYLSHESIVSSQVGGADRYPPYDAQVQSAKRAAWIFPTVSVEPPPINSQWGDSPVLQLGNLTSGMLVKYLVDNHIKYSEWTVPGDLVVVYPSTNVTPSVLASQG